jgi:dephospho-CoA kinase
MLLVALTGNIASGKSEVARRLAGHGATVIDADRLARRAVEPGTPAYTDIIARWGTRVLAPDESIDRDALRRIAFADAAELAALNAIVHPRVRALRDQLLDEARQRRDRVVISVIPLLFETGLEREFDRIVLVDAPARVRLERLMRRGQLDENEARRMMAAQLAPETKRARADYVIENDGTLQDLAARVDAVWDALEREAVES